MNDKELWAKRRAALLRHVDNVRNNCLLLGERLRDKGEIELAHALVANGYIHDNSKFHGIEWKYLHADCFESVPDLAKAAIHQHVHCNPHHPEFWQSIHNMPRIYVAELVCDWGARSSEFGNELRGWIKDKATKKFDMTVQSKVYKEIKEFVDIFLDPAFK